MKKWLMAILLLLMIAALLVLVPSGALMEETEDFCLRLLQ